MTLQSSLFYLLSSFTILCAGVVVWGRNMVHAVLFLIAAFLNTACLFLMLGAEFLALMLVIVYVGAVLVLFLFVVMMLNIDAMALKKDFHRYLPVAALVGFVMLLELIFVVGSRLLLPQDWKRMVSDPVSLAITNTRSLGQLFYTDYMPLFQISGLILLIAMIGTIVLTLRQRHGVKKQNIAEQVRKKAAGSIQIVKIKPKTGVSWQ